MLAYTVVGDTVNVASRLQSAARPGSVTVGERTMRATDAAVEYEALEPLDLKGKAELVPAWEAVGLIEEHAVRRVAPQASRRSSAGPGADALDSLYERVVREGTSHLVTVVGEAGVGKSRLLREFEVRLSEHPPRRRSAPVAASHTGAESSSGRSGRSARRVRHRRGRLLGGGVAEAPPRTWPT